MGPAADRELPAAELEALRREMVLYRCALRSVKAWLDNLDEYYAALADASPVENVRCRLKSVESIAGKLAARDLPLTAASAVENLTDIAGARVICSYTRDIAEIVAVLKTHRDLEVITEKDYVTHPKPSGYRSFHLVVSVMPGGLFGERSCPVEIQVRTAAMDFWASLEHKVRYKFAGDVPEHLRRELYLCAERTNSVDERLYLVHELVGLINERRTEERWTAARSGSTSPTTRRPSGAR